MVSETPYGCNTVGHELWWAILFLLLCPETDWNIRVGKQGYMFILTEFKRLITWRISARTEISAWPTGLKLCCDYMTNFSPGWNISLGAKYEIAREQSQENQNGAEKTNRENRCIVSLTVWPFGGAQFSTFWDGNSLQDDGTEAKPVFGCISLS